MDSTSQDLLIEAYRSLDLESGSLLPATDSPKDVDPETWIRLGGWLALAKKVGAEKVFFVDDNPVVIFVNSDEAEADWYRVFNRAWCMARPPLLFVAKLGELTVYDLTRAPVRRDEATGARAGRLLHVVRAATDIQRVLQRYHRANIEAGTIFDDNTFASDTRADKALAHDLRKVRRALLETGLSVEHAHTLIGRSIFIRYLEDRKILVEDYFLEVAGKNATWKQILKDAPVNWTRDDRRQVFYPAVLTNKAFTDALFARLASDFNGDLFPIDPDETKAFTAPRLDLVRRLLQGEVAGSTLFFFAYDFEIVPIDLISSIYEEFLKVERGKSNTNGSFYTPGALVNFVLSQTLDLKILNQRPRVIDPACGSGIFLVEAYQRVVRHRVQELGRRLRPQELRRILRDQIAGIDVNPEAIRVAAFSLYLSLFNFLDPPDILGHRLPALRYPLKRTVNLETECFNNLLVGNAFDVSAAANDGEVCRQFSEGCADVVVGNPPWGQPNEQDEETKTAAIAVVKWCEAAGKSVGDKELSQAFIHLSMELLRTGGRAGLLVSTGVFLKRMDQSRDFRREWLQQATLHDVVNFAAVRHIFFTGRGRSAGAIAPFASVTFTKRKADVRHKFRYFSAKETAFVSGLQAVLLSLPDLHTVSQASFFADDDLWKIYWWGGHRDEALIKALRVEEVLGDIVEGRGKYLKNFAVGFEEGKKGQKPTKRLHEYVELRGNAFGRYGVLSKDAFTKPPTKVKREPTETIYQGMRLLIGRGIVEKNGANGRIVSRLEDRPFCFRHSIFGLRLPDDAVPHAKLLLGILWSSLTRYFAWMASGSWGMWHHEILKETIRRMPVRLDAPQPLRSRIEGIVDELRSRGSDEPGLTAPEGSLTAAQIRALELDLDEAVFEMFDLDESERDLVRDMCGLGLDFFYRGRKSKAVKPLEFATDVDYAGTRYTITSNPNRFGAVGQYVDAFLDVWDNELRPDGHFSWRAFGTRHSSSMLALVFATEDESDAQMHQPDYAANGDWNIALQHLSDASRHVYGSKHIYIDGVTRITRPNDITIIKRNECRLWTRSAAREDAEATLLDAVRRQRALAGGGD